jgi:hypothetical protein
MRRCLAGWRCSVADSARRDAGAASLREIREKGRGIPHWMLPPPAVATKRRRHGAQESRTVGGAAGRVRRPSDRRLRGGAPSRSGDLCGPSNGEDCRGVAVAVVTGRPGTGRIRERAWRICLVSGVPVWKSGAPRVRDCNACARRLKGSAMNADRPLFPDPREAVPLGSYLDLALWLLGRNPLVADLAHRIPGVVTTGPRAPRTTPTRLALTIRARDRLSVA